jgi:hypothetical protein
MLTRNLSILVCHLLFAILLDSCKKSTPSAASTTPPPTQTRGLCGNYKKLKTIWQITQRLSVKIY